MSSSQLAKQFKTPAPGSGHAVQHAVQLTGLCPALTETTLVSNHITLSYHLRHFSIYFPAGCDNTVLCWPIIARDFSTSASGRPPGTSIITPLSPLEYIVGDDVIIAFPLNLIIQERGTWLKLHVDNQDGNDHRPLAIITIEELHQEK